MLIEIKIGSILLSMLFFYIFIRLVRCRFISPFFLILWSAIGFAMLTVWPFHDIYVKLAHVLGITDATYLFFIGGIVFLMVYCLYLTVQISLAADRIQELISFTASLEHKIRSLEVHETKDVPDSAQTKLHLFKT
jgi:hypothetical protein